jgi:hypothetical protein
MEVLYRIYAPYRHVDAILTPDFDCTVSEIAKNTMTPDVSSLDYAAFPRVAAKLTNGLAAA